ncbi:MAG: hypothetical protein ACM3O3_08175, partial [Syntrophothermus sp.]
MNKRTLILVFLLLFLRVSFPQSTWLISESKNFKIIYLEKHSGIIPHIIASAERSFAVLSKVFNYTLSEKIIINVYDINDYGFASATNVPENFIRLEIEPFEAGYENIPFNERIQWLISHELVHIVVNDKNSEFGNFLRSIVGKVAPEQMEPLSVFFSLLTNGNRYTPRWHQESIAVFCETWLSGGYGRVLGNFDEMYFRSLYLGENYFPSDVELDAKTSHNNYLLETLFYLYGGRFAAYLSLTYGPEKLVHWFSEDNNSITTSFKVSFESIFNISFNEAWKNFIDYERKFQEKNVEKIQKNPVTRINRLTKEPIGWVTSAYYDKDLNSLLFGYHKPHHLAAIQKFSLKDSTSEDIATLPSPSIYQVASTAYDSSNKLFFFTTNNNQLYRDVWVLDAKTNKSKLLFEDCRVGQLSISPATNDLFGVQHLLGKVSIIHSAYPYHQIDVIKTFPFGDEVQQISLSPSGNLVAIILHKQDGTQQLIISSIKSLLFDKELKFKFITDKGSPENPSWSNEENFLFWNAYVNGVSNIYRMNLLDNDIEPLTNVLTGLFRPLYLNEDSIFAFEFSAEGFYPVLIENKKADRLAAISYYGQELLNKNKNLITQFALNNNIDAAIYVAPDEYNGLEHLKVLTFIPVISGF